MLLQLDKSNISEVVSRAVSILKEGGLVIVPSDTVYGLCVDATNDDAVKKLIAFKSRPPGKAISIFVGTLERAKKYVVIPYAKEKVLQKILPGAYTIVLPSNHTVSKLIEAENGSLGIRVPDNEFCNELVNAFGKPITATSANQGGRSPHYSIESLLKSTPRSKHRLIDLVIDAGRLPRVKPSTVVNMVDDEVEILRQGDSSFGSSRVVFKSDSETETKEIAKKIFSEHTTRINLKPLAILLSGDLGAGKTVFTKGIGEALHIDNIVSPTFVIYYEYKPMHDTVDYLYHFDLYKIHDVDEFRQLGLEDFIKPRTVICIEWSEKSGDIMDMLKEKCDIVSVHMEHVTSERRSITVSA